MINTTSDLIAYLKRPGEERDSMVIDALVNAILLCGSKEDADALLPLFLDNPDAFDYSYLLTVIKRFGTRHHAEELYNKFIRHGKLADSAPNEILEVLGCLQYIPARPLLVNYAFGRDIETNYYLSQSAVLGLLNLDCSEYQQVIREEIEKCYRQNLFLEFVPALVCKLTDRNDYLEPLYELGNEYASTDCNAGIILGFSLCGDEGKKYFRKLLFNPNWETFSGGTGTTSFTYWGTKNLGMTFKELYTEIRQVSDHEQLDYALKVLFSLIDERISDYEGDHAETFKDLYHLFFKWKNGYESDNLVDLAGRVNRTDLAYQLERILKLKMTEEAVVSNR